MIKIFAFCVMLFVAANLVDINEGAQSDCTGNYTYTMCGVIPGCQPRCNINIHCLNTVCAKAGCYCIGRYRIRGSDGACVLTADC